MKHQTKTLALLLAVLLVFAFAACSDDDGGTTGTAGTPYTITLMCWNIEKFDATGSFAAAASEVKNQQADVLIVCEIQNNDGDQTSFSTALSSTSWPMTYQYVSSMSDGFNSIGVFSRYPVTSATEILKSGHVRSIYKIVVSLSNGRSMTLYGGHLKSGSDPASFLARESQSQALANYIRSNHNTATDYVAIMGDMNTMGSNSSAPVEDFQSGSTLDRLRLKDDGDAGNDFLAVNYTYLPTTYTHVWPSLLDHIILSPAATARYVSGSVSVPATDWEGAGIISDHRPVRVRLSIPQ